MFCSPQALSKQCSEKPRWNERAATCCCKAALSSFHAPHHTQENDITKGSCTQSGRVSAVGKRAAGEEKGWGELRVAWCTVRVNIRWSFLLFFCYFNTLWLLWDNVSVNNMFEFTRPHCWNRTRAGRRFQHPAVALDLCGLDHLCSPLHIHNMSPERHQKHMLLFERVIYRLWHFIH